MPELVPLVLWSWVPLSLILFRVLPAPAAAAFCLIGGWILLPNARFPDDVAGVDFPYWILPASVPSTFWISKARLIGVACLLGIVAFDSKSLRGFRPRVIDLLPLGWGLIPLASALANGLSFGRGLADSAYQLTVWGVPYLAGRLYFTDLPGRLLFARALVMGGLACVPGCLLEFATGPVLYPLLYGFHPYQYQGVDRYVGHRPLLFFEDGNQLGMMLATSSLAAVWLFRTGRLERILGLPGGLVVGILVLETALCQSAGSIGLLMLALFSLEVLSRLDRRWPALAVVGFGLLLVGVRALNLVDAKALAESNPVGRAAISALRSTGRGSFGWRLRVEERGARVALERPVLGWGEWNWWKKARDRPWSLFALVLGQYGLIGWTLLAVFLLAPPLGYLASGPPRFWAAGDQGATATLAAVLAINAADAFLNPAYLVFLIAAVPGVVISTLSRRPEVR